MAGKTLLLGHFSTVGDIACLGVVADFLNARGIPHDTCAFMEDVRKSIPGCLSPKELKPQNYGRLIFICGPIWPEFLASHEFDLGDFSHCARLAINTTMVKPVHEWNPFSHLIERDSDQKTRPDLSLFSNLKTLPVAGVCLIDQQGEYRDRQKHAETQLTVNTALKELGWARLELDTRWPGSRNAGKVESPEAFYSLVKRTDVLITNRLHGMVFALKAGVPAVVLDSIAGGDKVSRQARILGWPALLLPDQARPEKVIELARWCLTREAKIAAEKINETIKPAGAMIWSELQTALEDLQTAPLCPEPFQEKSEEQSLRARLKKFVGF